MPELKNLIQDDVAEAIRDHVMLLEQNPDPHRWSSPLQDVPEVFAPKGETNLVIVEREDNRVKCRECGQTITKGTRAIVFGWDPQYERTGGEGPWGHLTRAYIHDDSAECGGEKGEQHEGSDREDAAR